MLSLPRYPLKVLLFMNCLQGKVLTWANRQKGGGLQYRSLNYCMDMKFFPDIKLRGEMKILQRKLNQVIWSVNHGSAKSKSVQIARF